MSADMAGVSRLEFLRGQVSLDERNIRPEEWLVLLDDVLQGRLLLELECMQSLREIVEKSCTVIPSAHHSLAEGAYSRGGVRMQPGTRFLLCNFIEFGDAPDVIAYTRHLLLGRASEPYEVDDGRGGKRLRTWALFALKVLWRQTKSDAAHNVVYAWRLELVELAPDNLEALLSLTRTENPYAFAARKVLEELHRALAVSIRKLEDRSRQLARQRFAIAGVLERTGYWPFTAATQPH